MRAFALSILALAACFSKPPFSGAGDAGTDAVDARDTEVSPHEPAKLAAGGGHTCRIDASSRLLCWGDHGDRQLGDRDEPAGRTGVPAPAFEGVAQTGWTAVAAGATHTCGIRDGKVSCWGGNRHRQAAPSSAEPTASRTVLDVPGIAEKIFAGDTLSCAINTDGEAYCWGALDFDEGSEQIRRLGDRRFLAIAIGAEHACAIEGAGSAHAGPVRCWGNNEYLQLGRDGDTVPFDTPALIDVPATFTSIAAAASSTCGITVDGALACWGSPANGALGENPDGSIEEIDAKRTWARVTMGRAHVCAISDGLVFCYGDNADGALGRGRYAADRRLPAMPIAIGEPIRELVAGNGHTCARAADSDKTWCWGTNSFGELGKGPFARKTEPELVLNLPAGTVAELVAADDHTCARMIDGNSASVTYCWGLNENGQVNPEVAAASVGIPTLASQRSFVQIAAGRSHTCGRTDNGEIECWGDNARGQLGAPASTISRHLVDAPPGSRSGWWYLAAGGLMTCGIDNGPYNGRLSCWGQLVTGVFSSPEVIEHPPEKPWHSISIGTEAAVGVVSDWGYQVFGFGRRCDLGKGNSTVPIPENQPENLEIATSSMPRVTAAQAGGHHVCIQRGDLTSTLTCLGANTHRQLGAEHGGCTGYVDVPSGGAGPWAPAGLSGRVMAAADQTCAQGDTGTVMCWGHNDVGELGPDLGQLSPRQVNTYTWGAIAGGRVHTCGINAQSGHVYCWGENQYGALGDGSQFEPSPVRVLDPA